MDHTRNPGDDLASWSESGSLWLDYISLLLSPTESSGGGGTFTGSLLESEVLKYVLLLTVPKFLEKPPSTSKNLRKLELLISF